MAKTNNINTYEFDQDPSPYDYLLGTDSSTGRTKNFRIKETLQVVDDLEYISNDIIPSHTPVAVINNLAYKLDPSNPDHQFAFIGFSKNGNSIGDLCKIQTRGEIELQGWNLVQGQQYLSGPNGSLITDNIYPNNFTKVIGYAINSDKLKIIDSYSTINKS